MLLLVLPWTSSCCFLSKDLCFFPHKDLCVLLLLVLGCRDRLLVLVLVATWFWVLGKARVFQTVVAAIYPSCLFLCLFVCVFFGEMLWEEDKKTGRVVETGTFTYPIALLLEKSFWNEAPMAAAAGRALMVMVMIFHVWLEPLLVLVLVLVFSFFSFWQSCGRGPRSSNPREEKAVAGGASSHGGGWNSNSSKSNSSSTSQRRWRDCIPCGIIVFYCVWWSIGASGQMHSVSCFVFRALHHGTLERFEIHLSNIYLI